MPQPYSQRTTSRLQRYPGLPPEIMLLPSPPSMGLQILSPTIPRKPVPVAVPNLSVALPSPVSVSSASSVAPYSPASAYSPTSPASDSSLLPLKWSGATTKQHIVHQYQYPQSHDEWKTLSRPTHEYPNPHDHPALRSYKAQEQQHNEHKPFPSQLSSDQIPIQPVHKAHYFPPTPPSSPPGLSTSDDTHSIAPTVIEVASVCGAEEAPSRATSIMTSSSASCGGSECGDDERDDSGVERSEEDKDREGNMSLFALSELNLETSTSDSTALPDDHAQKITKYKQEYDISQCRCGMSHSVPPALPGQRHGIGERTTGLRKRGVGLKWEKLIRLGSDVSSSSGKQGSKKEGGKGLRSKLTPSRHSVDVSGGKANGHSTHSTITTGFRTVASTTFSTSSRQPLFPINTHAPSSDPKSAHSTTPTRTTQIACYNTVTSPTSPTNPPLSATSTWRSVGTEAMSFFEFDDGDNYKSIWKKLFKNRKWPWNNKSSKSGAGSGAGGRARSSQRVVARGTTRKSGGGFKVKLKGMILCGRS